MVITSSIVLSQSKTVSEEAVLLWFLDLTQRPANKVSEVAGLMTRSSRRSLLRESGAGSSEAFIQFPELN